MTVRIAVPPGPPVGFEQAGPYATRKRCQVCGARGYPGGAWMEPHRRGHRPCPRCGRQLPVKLDGTARIHTRCPQAAR